MAHSSPYFLNYMFARSTINIMETEAVISDEVIEVLINNSSTRVKQAIVNYLNDIEQNEDYFDVVKDTGTILNISEWSNKTKKNILDKIINNPKYIE